jgi:hypothetical protein
MLPGVTAADEIEITPQMTKAGADVLSENYFSLVDGDGYPEIARIVFEAMVAKSEKPRVSLRQIAQQ